VADCIIVLAIFAASATVAHRFIEGAGIRTFTEYESLPAAMIACGKGFTRPAAESAALVEFYMRRSGSLSCEDLTDGRPVFPITRAERYAVYGAAVAFRLGGVSWRSLDAYMGTLFGLAMALAYGLFRLAARRVPAVLGVGCLVISGHLLGLVSVRDYPKEPCFFAAWLTLGWLLKRGRDGASKALLFPAAVGGTVLGLGLGFRPDVLICVPVFVVVIMLAVPGYTRDKLKVKAAALAAWAFALVVAGFPILSSFTEGGNFAHVVVLGLTTSFERTLGLERPVYDIGGTYSDGYAYTLVAAHAANVEPDADPVTFATFGTARYDRLGARLLSDLAAHFPSDVLTRALAATAQVLRYPFDPVARHYFDLGNSLFDSVPSHKHWAESIGEVLTVFHGQAILLTVLVLLAIAVRDWRLGVLTGLLLMYFSGYTMLQFSRRHTFHLDLIPIGVLVIALDFVVDWAVHAWRFARGRLTEGRVNAQWAVRFRSGLIAMGALAGVVFAVLFSVRFWQQRHVTSLIERTLAVSWEAVETAPESPLDMSEPRYAAFLSKWPSALIWRVPTSADSSDDESKLEVNYLQVEIGGAACGQSMVLVAPVYAGSRHTVDREYTRVLEVRTDPNGAPTLLLMPAFYQHGSSWTGFEGIAVPTDSRSCVGGIRRAASTNAVPLPTLTAVLTPDWRSRPLYQRMETDSWTWTCPCPTRLPR